MKTVNRIALISIIIVLMAMVTVLNRKLYRLERRIDQYIQKNEVTNQIIKEISRRLELED